MTTTNAELSLTVSRTIQAGAEELYNAWLDPKMLVRFMTPGEGMTCPSAETDPAVGGKYRIVMSDGKNDIPHHGEYLELSPFKKIAFSWNSPHVDPGSEVHLTFTPEGDATRVELTHIKFRDEEARDAHNQGWSVIMDTLSGIYA